MGLKVLTVGTISKVKRQQVPGRRCRTHKSNDHLVSSTCTGREEERVYWSVDTQRESIAVDVQRNQQGLKVGMWWGCGGC